MNTTDFSNPSATETVSKPELTQVEQFAWALQRLATMQGGSIDVLSLNASASVFEQAIPAMQKLALMCQRMGLEAPKLVKHPDQVHMPMLAHTPELGWGVVVDRNALGQWIVLTPMGAKPVEDAALKNSVAILRLGRKV